MAAAAALAFALAGSALLLLAPAPSWRRRAGMAAGWFVALLAIGSLAQRLAGVDLGMDFPALQRWLRDAGPRPALMSAATSVAFIACAAVLIGGTAWRSPRRALVHDLLTAVVAAIGVLGLGGYVVSAPLLFPVYPFSGMALHTALGFIVLAAGLRRAAGPRAPR